MSQARWTSGPAAGQFPFRIPRIHCGAGLEAWLQSPDAGSYTTWWHTIRATPVMASMRRWSFDASPTSSLWLSHSAYAGCRVETGCSSKFHKVGSQPVEDIGCGSSRSGDGWRQGPPDSDINYAMSFDCA